MQKTIPRIVPYGPIFFLNDGILKNVQKDILHGSR